MTRKRKYGSFQEKTNKKRGEINGKKDGRFTLGKKRKVSREERAVSAKSVKGGKKRKLNVEDK